MRVAKRVAAIAAVVLPLAIGASAAWLAFSPSAARWLVRELIDLSEGRLAIVAVEGSLARGVSVEGLTYHQDGSRVDIDRAQATWSLSSLFRWQFTIRDLKLARVGISVTPASEPARVPASLAVPLGVAIDAGRIDELVIEHAGRQHRIEAIDFRGSSGRTQHRFDLTTARLPQGLVSGRFELSAKAPFALQARLMFAPAPSQSLPAADLALSGNLMELQAKLTAEADWLELSGAARIAPFEAMMIKQLTARAERVRVHQLVPDTVRADLRGTLELKQLSEDRFEAELRVQNVDSGELGERKLPVRELDARLDGTLDSIGITALELRMPHGSTLAGVGKWDSNGLDLNLAARALDLKAWDKRLVATRLGGPLRVRANPRTQSFDARLAQGEYRIEIEADRLGDRLTVKRASAAARGGRLTLSGHLELTAARMFSAKGQLHRFDPSAFVEAPQARIDADISAQGKLLPQWSAQVSVRANGVGPRGQAFAADGRALISQRRVADLNARVTVGRNAATVTGAYGHDADALAFDANLRALNELDSRFGGALEGRGKIVGDIERPEIRVDARGTRLSAPGKLRVASVRLRATIPNDWEKAIDIEAVAVDMQVDSVRIGKAIATVRGTPRAHTLDLVAQSSELDAALQLSGGLSSLRAWKGEMTRLEVKKPTTIALRAPARLSLAPERVDLGGLSLAANGARVSIASSSWTPEAFTTSGEFAELRIGHFLRGIKTQAQSSLSLRGDWTIEARGGLLSGRMNVVRETGDIVMRGDTELPLLLSALQLQAVVDSNRIRATAQASSTTLGEFHVEAATELARSGNVWAVAASAPLTLDAQGDFPSIAWIGPLIDPGLVISGALSVRAKGRGTAGAPKLEGTIQGTALALRMPATGIALGDGHLDATLVDDRILVRELRLKGGEGFVNVQGEARLRKGSSANLRLNATRLKLLNRRDAQLELDATGDIVSREDGLLEIKGAARITRAQIDLLHNADAPALASDIHVKRDTASPPARQPMRLSVDLSTDFGEHFTVTARGLGSGTDPILDRLSGDFKARIEGRIHTRSDANQVPQTTGNLRVVDGSYSALGRQLKVARGNLNFVGPMNNPALDIFVAAARHDLRFAPEVGISITGTTRAPHVRLVSRPEMPDTEKLSWLLFGRGGQTVDYSVGTVTGRMAAPVTAFGWQLAENLYLAYERGATGTASVVRIYSSVTDQIAIQAGVGDASSLFLLYTFSFE